MSGTCTGRGLWPRQSRASPGRGLAAGVARDGGRLCRISYTAYLPSLAELTNENNGAHPSAQPALARPGGGRIDPVITSSPPPCPAATTTMRADAGVIPARRSLALLFFHGAMQNARWKTRVSIAASA